MKIYYKHIGVEYIARSLLVSFHSKQIKCSLTSEIDPDSDELYILCIENCYLEKIPKRFIVFQKEQTSYLSEESDIDAYWIPNEYYDLLNKAIEVWDYSLRNISILRKKVSPNVVFRHIPFYFSSFGGYYFNKKKEVKNIYDVLYIGKVHKRSQPIIESIKKWCNVKCIENVFRDDCLDYIRQSKIVVYIDQYEKNILQTHWISYVVSNKVCMVCETSRDTELNEQYKDIVILSDLQNIAIECIKYYKNTTKRNDHILRSYKSLQQKHLIDSIPTESIVFSEALNHTPSKVKLDIYKPNDIVDADTKVVNKSQLVLELPEIDLDNLPKVSLATPTGNRRTLFSMAIHNWENTIYNKNLIEWVILDDGKEELSDIIPTDKNIKYVKLDIENRLPIGEKRNKLVELCSHDIILFMDDDDYYSPDHVLSRVKTLLKYKSKGVQCVGCKEIAGYHLLEDYSMSTSNGNRFVTESSLGFYRSFWEERKFELVKHSEFRSFLEYRQHQVIALPYQFVTIALTHGDNATGNVRTYMGFKKWIQKNQHQYKNIIDTLEDETQMFLMDLRRIILQKKLAVVN